MMFTATAARLATINASTMLNDALKRLVTAFTKKVCEFHAIGTLGRTQLQDAVPMTLGQEFMASLRLSTKTLKKLPEISGNFIEVSLGGTAIGSGINAPKGYREMALRKLCELTGIGWCTLMI